MSDPDPFEELIGPQGQAVRRLVRWAADFPSVTRQRAFYGALEESLEDFAAVCESLDRAEVEFLTAKDKQGPERPFADHLGDLARARVAAISYFNAGYALLDAIAAFELGDHPKSPWVVWAQRQETPSADPTRRLLARILTFRLREPRHVIAVHRHGWSVPVLIVGGGSLSLARRPGYPPPQVSPELVGETERALDLLGLAYSPDPQHISMAAERFADRAGLCTPAMRRLFGRLVNRFGIQTTPVSRITPAVITLLERSLALPSASRERQT